MRCVPLFHVVLFWLCLGCQIASCVRLCQARQTASSACSLCYQLYRTFMNIIVAVFHPRCSGVHVFFPLVMASKQSWWQSSWWDDSVTVWKAPEWQQADDAWRQSWWQRSWGADSGTDWQTQSTGRTQYFDISSPTGAASASSWPPLPALPVTSDPWQNYDKTMLKVLDKQDAEVQVVRPSLRIDNLGKAFKNYRRSILHHLNVWRFRKELFWGWRRCCGDSVGQVTFEEQVWTDDNM